MKRYLQSLLIGLLVLWLSGCNFNVFGIFNQKDTVTVLDMSGEYEFITEEIDIFFFNNDNSYPYINVDEFLSLLDPGLVELDISVENDQLEVSYTTSFYGQDDYIFELAIDAENDVLEYNDFYFGTGINAEGITVYDTSVELLSTEVTNNHSLNRTIQLSEYDIDIVKESNQFYMPLSLADLLFTGSAINIYYDRFNFIVYDFTSTDFSEYEFSEEKINIDGEKLIQNTANFAVFLLENYYGLNEYKVNIDYKQEFIDNGLYDTDSIDEFDVLFTHFISTLDDPHTMILDYGLVEDEVALITQYTGKTNDIQDDYIFYNFYEKNYEMKLYSEDEYYVLDIVNFTLDTKDDLRMKLNAIDPDKDIYIDLSSNTGGTIISIIELLSYMTNDPIELIYKNPKTGVVITETYDTSGIDALPNDFVLFTSNATFSAANLFVSIVKEKELGLIMGTNTSGGTCTVEYVTFPNNLMMTYSTNTMLLNEELEPIEEGIEPNYSIPDHSIVAYGYENVERFKNNAIETDIVSSSTSKDIDITISTTSASDALDSYYYEIIITDELTNSVLIQTITNDTHYQYSFDDYQDYIKIEVLTHFVYNDFVYSNVLISDQLDDLADDISNTDRTLNINEVYTFNCYDIYEDFETYKVVITESGTYQVLQDGNPYLTHIYNGEKTYLYGSMSFNLEPGTYYFKTSPLTLKKDYTLQIIEVQDN